MKFTVVCKNHVVDVKGQDDEKVKYLMKGDDDDGKEYCALLWKALNWNPVIYDKQYDEEISKYNWFVTNGGYLSHKIDYMHIFVAKLMKIHGTKPTIDHINGIKFDNRTKNLRAATMSEQNSNRAVRSDKLAPCEELQNCGVQELPKYVRYDRTEQKFIIEKHPQLMEEVKQNMRKKPCISGTKSAKLSMIEKYNDILSRLQDLDMKANLFSNESFKHMKQENYDEYYAIVNSIKIYEGEEVSSVPKLTEDSAEEIKAKRSTAPGKKGVSKLPENCGVNHVDIPKYCYYVPKSEKRSDKFVIDRHPTLLKDGVQQWATTSKSLLTTKQKFDLLIEKYNELQSNNPVVLIK